MKYFLLLMFVLISFHNGFPQYKVSINSGYGIYLSNSENDTKAMGDKEFRSYIPVGINISNGNILGSTIELSYSYNKSSQEDVHKLYITSSLTPEIIDSIRFDMSLINHSIDLNYVGTIGTSFNFGIGPSFVITNRILESTEILITELEKSRGIYDKLASSGIGLNGYLEFVMPFTIGKNYFYLASRVKARYTHSIWFDEGIRNLDDYSQDFFVSEITLGFGYLF